MGAGNRPARNSTSCVASRSPAAAHACRRRRGGSGADEDTPPTPAHTTSRSRHDRARRRPGPLRLGVGRAPTARTSCSAWTAITTTKSGATICTGGGVPLFERMRLEAFQRRPVLADHLLLLLNRQNFRHAFAGFDIEKVAGFTDYLVARLYGDHRAWLLACRRRCAKIEATIAMRGATASTASTSDAALVVCAGEATAPREHCCIPRRRRNPPPWHAIEAPRVPLRRSVHLPTAAPCTGTDPPPAVVPGAFKRRLKRLAGGGHDNCPCAEEQWSEMCVQVELVRDLEGGADGGDEARTGDVHRKRRRGARHR